MTHGVVVTHVEPDTLDCEVRWALGSIMTNKGSGGDGIPAELLQILKDDAVKMLHSICKFGKLWKYGNLEICSKFGKLSSGHRNGKGQFSFQSQRTAMPKNAQTTAQLYPPHTLVK